VYFANVLAMCHEAYEASLAPVLAQAGSSLRAFFSNPQVALPIRQAQIDFLQPMFCGDRYQIHLNPEQLTDSKFQIHYQIFPDQTTAPLIGQATTLHLCINPIERSRHPLPPEILHWLSLSKKEKSANQ
jgi:1,4-dihydroxy-2-naphthoyl-CoA hydrolase